MEGLAGTPCGRDELMGPDLLCRGRGGAGRGSCEGEVSLFLRCYLDFSQSSFPPSMERHKQLSLGEGSFGG